MDSKNFKPIFHKIAKDNGFKGAFGGWIKQSAECIAVLDLQKSNFGNYFEMNIKIYIQGLFGQKYLINKDIIKKDTGDIFTRQPSKYNAIFDFDTFVSDECREKQLYDLFSEFIVPFIDKSLSVTGIRKLADDNEIHLLPAVRKDLGW